MDEGLLVWLLSPIDPGRPHAVGFAVSWHARLMVVAWSALAPAGVIAARYFKVWPGQDWPRQLDDKRWWRSHRVCQWTAAGLSALALALVLFGGAAAGGGWPHAVLGWAVLALLAAQVLGGWLRGTKGGPTDIAMRGDHFDMTPRRIVFEYVHKTLGYVALMLAAAAIFSGLWRANAPVWMWLALGPWWIGVAALFATLQRRRPVLDTYQAIWGCDPTLPGARRAPIGFGVRRARRQR